MSEKYAIQLGLEISRESRHIKKVTVGNKKDATTTGLASAPFSFRGEDPIYPLKFYLLPDCVRDVILGNPFIKATKTFSNLSNFYRRLKRRAAQAISAYHLLFLGNSAPQFNGFINGMPQEALADSGAQVMVMDEKYARSIGLEIKTGREERTKLIFADKSTAFTKGMAYGVEWKFRSPTDESSNLYRLNFHILENAPADVILCDSFLFETEAFSRYAYCLQESDDEEDGDWEQHCFAISKAPRRKAKQEADLLSYIDLSHLEVIRRGKAEDQIAQLDLSEQSVAWEKEMRERAQWEQKMTAMQAGQTQSGGSPLSSTSSPYSSVSSTPQSAHSSASSTVDSGRNTLGSALRSFWRRRSKSKQADPNLPAVATNSNVS
jgi:hypothetical protein